MKQRVPLEFMHVDVFSRTPYGGNSLPVFLDGQLLSSDQMLLITQELHHFEAIFLEQTDVPNTVRARVFDLFEELPFAGHPAIGAAAALHHASRSFAPQAWRIRLPSKTVTVTTERTGYGYSAWLDQGAPDFIGGVASTPQLAAAIGLEHGDLSANLPPEVVSTGLRYLIVPVTREALARAKIRSDITSFLRSVGAQFAVVLDEEAVEIRHWNNDGIAEDVATGSAAGTIGAGSAMA